MKLYMKIYENIYYEINIFSNIIKFYKNVVWYLLIEILN